MPDAKLVTDIIFVICAGSAVILSLMVVTLRNPIYCSLALVASFIPIAAIYVLFNAPFIAAIQILVYAGAIMVLFTFVIMMIDLSKAEYTISKHKVFQLVSLFVVGLLVAFLPGLVKKMLPEQILAPKVAEIAEFGATKSIGKLIFGLPDKDPVKADLNTLNSMQIVSFELSSILIIVAIIGALVLGRARRRGDK